MLDANDNGDGKAHVDNLSVTGDGLPDFYFYDGFESGTLIPGGWSTSGSPTVITDDIDSNNPDIWTDDSASPASNGDGKALELNGNSGGETASTTISTAGYKNIKVRYALKIDGLDAGDTFDAQYTTNGSTWTNLQAQVVGASGTGDDTEHATFLSDLSAITAANNNASFAIRFVSATGNTDDRTFIDDVLVWGEVQGDVTAPVLAEVTPVGTPTNDSTPDYTFSSDEAGTISYGGDCSSTTSAAVVGNNAITFNALADGTHTNCTIVVTDASSNASIPLAVSSFTVDTGTPTLVLSSTASNPANTSPIPITATFSEAVSGFTAGDLNVDVTSSNGTLSNFAGSGPYTFDVTPDTEGDVTITVAASTFTDLAGNSTSTDAVFTIVYATTSPSVSITDPATDSEYTNNDSPTILFSVSQSPILPGNTIASVECDLDGGGFIGCDSFSSHALSGLSDGSHTIDVKATDDATNFSTASRQFYVDTVNPVPTISSTAVIGGYASSSPIAMAISFTEDVINFVLGDVTLGGGSGGAFAGSGSAYTFDFTLTVDGAVTIDIAGGVADEANGSGNTNDAATQFAFIYDSTAPLISITSGPSDGGFSTTASPSFAFTITDDNPTTETCTVDGGTPTSPCTSPQVLGPLSEGSHTFDISSTDDAGNSSSESRTFTVDTIAPTLAEVTPVPSPDTDSTPNYTFSSSEAGTIAYGGSCSSVTAAAVAGNNTVTFNGLGDQTYSDCTIVVTDAAGNTSATLAVSSFTITPSSSGGSGGGGGGIIGGPLGFGAGGGAVLGTTTISTPPPSPTPQGQVLGSESCTALITTTPLGLGLTNPPSQVIALQTFLNGEVSAGLPVTGFFGPLTKGAVETFQLKYSSEVLAPWVPLGLPSATTATGLVGKTSAWKINMISCPSLNLPFPTLP